MEDDELFLDDEEEMSDVSDKPKSKGKSKAKKTSAGAAKTADAKQVNKPAKTPVPVAAAQGDSQNVSLWVASVLAICTFVVGFVAGAIVYGGSAQQASEPIPSGTTGLPGGTPAAPLTQDQLKKGLPQGHPSIPGQTPGGSTTTAPKSKKTSK